MRYIVEIRAANKGYECEVRQEAPTFKCRSFKAALDPQAEILIKGKRYSLKDLINILLDNQEAELKEVFDETGQLAIGRYLYNQLFGGLEQPEQKVLCNTNLELLIVTQDEHIARLPWVLLNNGNFLCAQGWSVALNSIGNFDVAELPGSPRILIVAPQPAKLDETYADLHLASLKELLTDANPRFSKEHNLQVACTWEDFKEKVESLKPDVVYFYGHGKGNMYTSRLLFTEQKSGRATEIPIVELASCLKNQIGGPPRLVYLNCCYGDSGGILGAGMQLRGFIPAVITNFTAADIKAAQIQAQTFLTNLLIEGKPPHISMAEMRRKLIGVKLSFKEVHWMNLVLHCNYSTWLSNPPKSVSRLERDSYWQLKIDRRNQLSRVWFDAQKMLTERSPRSLAYLCYGEEGQGQDIFYKRLSIELKGGFTGSKSLEYIPEWPKEYSNPTLSFAGALTEAFDALSVDEIPSRIRRDGGYSSQQLLIYIRHLPVNKNSPVTLDLIKEYLRWWDEYFIPMLDVNMFSLLGISFEVEEALLFRNTLSSKGINGLNFKFRNTVLYTLDELTNLNENDLLDFIQRYKIPIPREQIAEVIRNVLKSSGGDYEKTSEIMKAVERGDWIKYVTR
jgi:hypothetical protein